MTDRVCVVGLGLIGGSVLRAAVAAAWTGWGVDREAVGAPGLDVGTDLVGALRRAARDDALVVLAVPVTAVDDVLQAVALHAPGVALTDVISVKAPVAAAVARHGLAARHVGGHPMAGRAASGWTAGSADLFDGAAWMLAADDGLDLATWWRVAALVWDCGAHVVPAGVGEHDAAVARISHVPHLVAAVLASVGADGGPLALGLAAGSFRDGTRVAGSAPELTRAMLEANRPALLEVLDDAVARLGVARATLASSGSVAATVRAGYAARTLFTEHAPFEITDTTDLATLRAAGHTGGVLHRR